MNNSFLLKKERHKHFSSHKKRPFAEKSYSKIETGCITESLLVRSQYIPNQVKVLRGFNTPLIVMSNFVKNLYIFNNFQSRNMKLWSHILILDLD